MKLASSERPLTPIERTFLLHLLESKTIDDRVIKKIYDVGWDKIRLKELLAFVRYSTRVPFVDSKKAELGLLMINAMGGYSINAEGVFTLSGIAYTLDGEPLSKDYSRVTVTQYGPPFDIDRNKRFTIAILRYLEMEYPAGKKSAVVNPEAPTTSFPWQYVVIAVAVSLFYFYTY